MYSTNKVLTPTEFLELKTPKYLLVSLKTLKNFFFLFNDENETTLNKSFIYILKKILKL